MQISLFSVSKRLASMPVLFPLLAHLSLPGPFPLFSQDSAEPFPPLGSHLSTLTEYPISAPVVPRSSLLTAALLGLYSRKQFHIHPRPAMEMSSWESHFSTSAIWVHKAKSLRTTFSVFCEGNFVIVLFSSDSLKSLLQVSQTCFLPLTKCTVSSSKSWVDL